MKDQWPFWNIGEGYPSPKRYAPTPMGGAATLPRRPTNPVLPYSPYSQFSPQPCRASRRLDGRKVDCTAAHSRRWPRHWLPLPTPPPLSASQSQKPSAGQSQIDTARPPGQSQIAAASQMRWAHLRQLRLPARLFETHCDTFEINRDSYQQKWAWSKWDNISAVKHYNLFFFL